MVIVGELIVNKQDRSTLPPSGPPGRQMKETFFCGLIETEYSKLRRKLYKAYIAGYKNKDFYEWLKGEGFDEH